MAENDRTSGPRILASVLERLHSTVPSGTDIVFHRTVFIRPFADERYVQMLSMHRAWLTLPRSGVHCWAFSLAVDVEHPDAVAARSELIVLRLEPMDYDHPSDYDVGRTIVRRLETLADPSSMRRYATLENGRLLIPVDDPVHAFLARTVEACAQTTLVDNFFVWTYPHLRTSRLIADALRGILDL